jgi:hypothetical protein
MFSRVKLRRKYTISCDIVLLFQRSTACNLKIFLYFSMIKSRRMRWAGHVARMREKRNAYRILLGKPEGRRPLGRPRRRWMEIGRAHV